MFARVITAHTEADGFERFLTFARRELPTGAGMPGFSGYFVLTDTDHRDVMVISLWETRAQMESVAEGQPAGIRHGESHATGLSTMTLQTYEVALHAPAPTIPE